MKQNTRTMTANKIKLSGISLALAMTLSACGSDAPGAVTPAPSPYEQPVAQQESYSLLKQNGTIWMNQQNQKVSLRGINLGNWLAMEMWMLEMSDNPLGENIPDQYSLEEKLSERFGETEKEHLMTVFRDNWITENDWDVIAESGFNLVRIPFLYSLLEDDDNPKTLKEDAWHYLDWAIAEAKERELYVILDLHGAAGRQGWEQHTGREGQNKLWESDEYRDRTLWLWRQIADRYKDEAAIAGYGLLNEPWGTDSQTLKDFSLELYQAVREVDNKHIVILPGHNSDGIEAYGDPFDLGMTNVAFEIHQYPGIFGWGEIGYEVHRDWLTCGENGATGVCDWAKRARDVYTPLLVGELQPWTGLGELGGPITRATFDTFNDLNWAATAWSYKTTSPAGGLGNGQWGLVTNNGDQLLAKAETWSCNDWESTFSDACSGPAKSTTPYSGEGSKTMYLVIKTGAFNGSDVTYDNIQLTNDVTGENILINGDFGSDSGWTELSLWGDPRTYDFNYDAGEFAGSDTGPALRITSPAGNHSLIYQAVQVEGGQSYTLSGKFKDNGAGGNDMWAEIYLVPDMPQEWVDVQGRSLPQIDVNSSSKEEIEAYFAAFGTMDYILNDYVLEAMTAEQAPEIFTNIPSKPADLALTVGEEIIGLSWNAAEGDVDGYKVYRSTASRSGFEVIAETSSTSYTDNITSNGTTYYYYVAAFNDIDLGYGSEIAASGPSFFSVPGLIEAENYTSAHPGVQTETSGDNGGGSNIGHFEIDRWVDYDVKIDSAGEYTVEYRLATVPGSDGFSLLIGDEVLDTVTVPATGGWQDYITVTSTVTLPEGEHTIRLNSNGQEWNLNWFRFTKSE
ncbi:cellulase family glycosylhydrolase [Thalassomonas viridans]|uniref:Cellulase family glycosylhydrolase n=1 Tax=Thalassomonas viridans TaxID=137584 RepID=A0AAE9Z701_9GAMM|nr:carbohydrate-binding protein [Thalassomonas viridans]WDE06272.1 cellulase family glycosylhydrolase [Thalassomonas viridans]